VSPGCAMGFACGREVAGGGERRGRGGGGHPHPGCCTSAADPVFAGPAVRARVHVRVAGEGREGRGGGSREEEEGWDGRSGAEGESVALAPVAGQRKLAQPSRPVCGPPPSVSACAARLGTARGRPAPAGTSYGCRGSRAPSRGGEKSRCEVLRRARWSSRGAATGGTLLKSCTASRTRVRVRELATRACGVPARRASSTRVEVERPEVWGRARRRRRARLGARVDTERG
jgi:hypothetical protein